MESRDNMDKRKHKRFNTNVSTIISNIRCRPRPVEFTETVNISKSGAALKVKEDIGIYSDLQISLFLPCSKGPDEYVKFSTLAKVVRIDNQFEESSYIIGVEYNGIDEDNINKIDGYIDGLNSRHI